MEILSSIGNWCSGFSSGHGAGFGHGAGYGMGSWMPFHFGGILQLIVIGLIIYFTLRMFRKPVPVNQEDSIMEMVRRRYASGEIDEETYRRMKDQLK